MKIQGVSAISETKESGTETLSQRNSAEIILAKESKTTFEDGAILTISEEAKQMSTDSKDTAANNLQELKEMYQEMLQNEHTNADDSAKESRVQMKCLIIAGRIAAGDDVPYQDTCYLQKNNSELYCQALKMRIPRVHPRECDSILDDEDFETDEIETTDDLPTPSENSEDTESSPESLGNDFSLHGLT